MVTFNWSFISFFIERDFSLVVYILIKEYKATLIYLIFSVEIYV
jgi:hypothetical protein